MHQILIIDDDPTTRLTLSRLLKGQGFTVASAKDGKEGVAKAEELNPALIICDWMMPEMDGLAVCDYIRKSPSLAHTYFILLTAKDQEGDIIQGLEAGADDFLPKPPRSGELKARVRAGLRVYNANLTIQKQKALLEQELLQASEYVRSLLPRNLDSEVKINSCFIPSARLGGDCFDFFWTDADHLVFYLLDVSGHGVGSALLSVSVLNLLRTRGLLQNPLAGTIDFHNPVEILEDLNNTFQMSGHREMFFTIWYGVYSRSTGELRYSSAGHPPALLIRDGQVHKLKTVGIPIGMLPIGNYQQGSIQVQAGDRLYLFSDGAFEIPMGEGEIVGLAKLTELLIQAGHVEQVVTELQQLGAFHDDFSLLAVNF